MERPGPHVREGESLIKQVALILGLEGADGKISKAVQFIQLNYGNSLANLGRVQEPEMVQLFEQMARIPQDKPEKTVELVLLFGRGCMARGVAIGQRMERTCDECGHVVNLVCTECEEDENAD